MALVVGVKVGDVVDVAHHWIAVLFVDGPYTATVITDDGKKFNISSDRETEMVPGVWVQLGPRTSKLQLLFEAPRKISITLRRELHD
jgi:hypothetical protein